MKKVCFSIILLLGYCTLYSQKLEIQEFAFSCASFDYYDGVKVIDDIWSYNKVKDYTESNWYDCSGVIPSIDEGRNGLVFFYVEYERNHYVKFSEVKTKQNDIDKIIVVIQKYQIIEGIAPCGVPGCKVLHFSSREGAARKNVIIKKPNVNYRIIAKLEPTNW